MARKAPFRRSLGQRHGLARGFSQSRRNCLEIRDSLRSGCHLWAKGCDKALFGLLQRSEEDDQNPFGHFPNSVGRVILRTSS